MSCTTAGTYTPGTERYEFQGFANIGATSGIPTSCCNIRFVYEECCRSNAINTGATWQNFYVDAVVNRCLSISPCNGSPKFTTEPYDIVCGGAPVQYSNGTIEPDKDSLSFEFTPALLGFGSSVTYDPPFAYNKPMPWIGNWNDPFPAGIHCDPQTGDITFMPGSGFSSNFTGIIAIMVKQWKNISGVPTVIGTTRRDIQMVVSANCASNNQPWIVTTPSLGNNPNTPKSNWEICEGEQLCFTLTAKDTDTSPVSDTTYLSWDGALASLGATFIPNYVMGNRKTNGPREDSYQFCWTPPTGTASNNPYIFVVKNSDNKCPLPGRIAHAFSIKVQSVPDISITQTNLKCGKYKLSYTNPTPAKTVDSVKWKIAKAPFDYTFASGADTFANRITLPDLSFTASGKYLVQLTLAKSICTKVLYDTLVVDTFLKATAMNDTLICKGNNITLKASAKYGQMTYTYRWYNSIKDTALPPLNGPVFTNPNLNVTPAISKMYTVQVRDQFTCRAYDSVWVMVNKDSKNTVVKNVTCNGLNNGSITLNMQDSLMPFQYKINGGNFQSSNLFSGLTPGIYALEAKDSNNCSTSVSGINIKQPEVLLDSVTTTTNETCKGLNNGTLTIYTKGGTAPLRYSMDSVLFNNNRLFSNLPPASYKIHILDSNNCYTSVTRTIAPADSLYHLTSVLNPTCFGKNNGEIRTEGKGGKAPYTFLLGTTGIYNNDSIYENLVAGTYTINIKDNFGCVISVLKTLVTPPQIVAGSITGKTIAIQNVAETYSVNPQAGLSYLWGAQNGTILSGQNTPSVSVNWDSVGVGQIGVAVYSDSTCGDTTSLVVNIGVNGLSELAQNFGLKVYPNPSSGLVNITLQKLPAEHSLKLYDIQGKLLIDQELKTSQQLNLETLPQGVYVLKIGEWRGQIVKK